MLDGEWRGRWHGAPLVRFVLSLYSAELIRLAKNHALSRASAKCSTAFFEPYFCTGRTMRLIHERELFTCRCDSPFITCLDTRVFFSERAFVKSTHPREGDTLEMKMLLRGNARVMLFIDYST